MIVFYLKETSIRVNSPMWEVVNIQLSIVKYEYDVMTVKNIIRYTEYIIMLMNVNMLLHVYK